MILYIWIASMIIIIILAVISNINDEKMKKNARYCIEGKIIACDPITQETESGNLRFTCSVKFEDGRSIKFNSISSKPIELGKYYRIIYNGFYIIIEIEEQHV